MKIKTKFVVENESVEIDDLKFDLTVEEYDLVDIIDHITDDRAYCYDRIREISGQDLTDKQAYMLINSLAEHFAKKAQKQAQKIKNKVTPPR